MPMKRRTTQLVTVGFIIGLLLLALNAVLPYHNAARQAELDRSVAHAQLVLAAIHRLDMALVEAETAQRGYLLTGLHSFKDAFGLYRHAVQERFQELRRLAEENAEQQQRLLRLEVLLEDSLSRFSHHIDVFDTHGLEAARAIVTERRKNRTARDIDNHMDGIQRAEEELLSSRVTLAKAAAERTLVSFFAITSFNILLFCGLYYAVTRSFRKSSSAEQALKEQSDLQSSILNSMSEGLGVVDGQGRLILANPAAEQILGQKLEHCDLNQWQEAFGFFHAERLSPVTADELPLAKVLKGEPGKTLEIFMRHPHNGLEKFLALTARAIKGRDGCIRGGVGIFADITQRKRQQREVQEANERLTRNLRELRRRNEEVNALNEMSGLLQACNDVGEAFAVVAKSASSLFPAFSGSLYLQNASKNLFELAQHWGEDRQLLAVFEPQDCWCIRRSRAHQVRELGHHTRCTHAMRSSPAALHSLCAPLTAQGEVFGLLFLEGRSVEDGGAAASLQLVTMLCEQAGLALSNLKLQTTLRIQSDEDALTGLFNRRYLEACLARECARADRTAQPLSLLILDIDHFKKINDTYGHDTGDLVLKALAQTVKGVLRQSDLACRFGGEEFVVLLPETGPGGAIEGAERVLEAVRKLSLCTGRSQSLGPITASIGLAVYPADGTTAEALLKSADTHLYQAKRGGRNRLVAAQQHRFAQAVR